MVRAVTATGRQRHAFGVVEIGAMLAHHFRTRRPSCVLAWTLPGRFRLWVSSDPSTNREVRGPASLAAAVITAAVRAAGTLDSPLLRQASIIEIDIDRDPLDFDITPGEARELFAVGHATARAHFAKEHERLPSYDLVPDRPVQATRRGSRAGVAD